MTNTLFVQIQMLDVTEPELVEITIDPLGSRVWVNIDGICRLRACRIKTLQITDDRSQK